MSTVPLLARGVGSTSLWRSGAIIATFGIVSGAFGAHGLKKRAGVTSDDLHAWETASSYAVYNGLGLLLVSLHPRFASHRFAGPAIALGGTIFSGSIMSLVLFKKWKSTVGPITPVGGLIMMAGYVALAL